MPNPYFANFPLTKYNGVYVRNLILRAKFFRSVLSNYSAFYPHVIEEGQTPESIAFDYYGDCDLDWIVFFSNDITDPYYEWPMSNELFEQYIVKKYGRYETAVDTIHHYKYNNDVQMNDPNAAYTSDYKMTPETYSFLTTIEKSYWREVSCFDYEDELNESKRTIQLLDQRLTDQLLREIAEIMY